MFRSLIAFVKDNWSFLLTFFYFGYLASLVRHNDQSLFELSLNELGDFLAGTIGPVAFFWLVHGYFQQNAAIKIQSNELKAAVDQHKAQVKATTILAEHDLRLARIDYYRLLAESGGTIRECKRLLIEQKSMSSGLRALSSGNPFRSPFSINYGRPDERPILSKRLAKFSQDQQKYEHDVVHLNSQSFGELETNFLIIMKHAAEARSLLQEIETYISSQRQVTIG